MDAKGFVIAIDGPVASGKGTIALSLSKKLNAFYLYTGAMYRCIALLCIRKNLDLNKESETRKVLNEFNIQLSDNRVYLNGEDVTDRIKEPDTASGASVVGTYPNIRKAAVAVQQKIAAEYIDSGKIVVAEGRDTGTVVFPDASVKIYLTARAEVRAKRRMEQYGSMNEEDLKKQLEELKIRDNRDSGRDVSPLSMHPSDLGYFILDNSDFSEEETVDAIKQELEKRGLM